LHTSTRNGEQCKTPIGKRTDIPAQFEIMSFFAYPMAIGCAPKQLTMQKLPKNLLVINKIFSKKFLFFLIKENKKFIFLLHILILLQNLPMPLQERCYPIVLLFIFIKGKEQFYVNATRTFFVRPKFNFNRSYFDIRKSR
jgi:hypothetical protein